MMDVIKSTKLIVNINDERFESYMKMADAMGIDTIVIDEEDVLSIDNQPITSDKKIYIVDVEPLESVLPAGRSNMAERKAAAQSAVHAEFQNVEDEPENIDKVVSMDFLKAQLSTKNQMKIRNIIALLSSCAVLIAFILEKLGIL